MDDDLTATIVVWFVKLLGIALVLPLLLAAGVVLGFAKLAALLAVRCELVRRHRYRRELRRTIRARNQAIRNILRLQHRAERQMDRCVQPPTYRHSIQRRRRP